MSINQTYHKKTILQVVPALNAGGVERGTLEIAKKIVQSGHKSIVISSGGKMLPQLEQEGSIHIYMDVASKNPFKIWGNSYKLATIINEMDIDIVHARSRIPAWSCYLACKQTKANFVTTFHGIYSFGNAIKKYYNSIMTKGQKVIAVSNFVKEHMMNNYEIASDKIKVIHRGVNCDIFSPEQVNEEMREKFREKYNVPKNTPVILLPARMTRWKGQLFLLEAIKQIKHLDFYCIMAGDLAKHPQFVVELLSKIEEYKLQNRVQIFGNESNIVGLYAIADIVLSTSIAPEAFGRTIIEAQAMKKIVLATNIGGACETIQDQVTGFHVKSNDSFDLTKKIQHALELVGTKEAQELGERARQSVIENFSLDKMLDSTMEIYNMF
jgi:glycosyltransferase involved in cell wall biosynthesis